MIEAARALLEASPMLALFLAIGLGYALGQVPVFGVSFGAGAVLFSGLAIGAFAPGAAPPGLVGTLGLLMFLYGVGIAYGPQFVAGLSGRGLLLNALALAAVLAALALALLLGRLLGVGEAVAVGLFAGAGTSTAALQAAISASGGNAPAVGYGVAYPAGVIVPILLMAWAKRRLGAEVPPTPPAMRVAEVTLARGGTIGAILAALPEGVRLLAHRHDHANALPEPADRAEAGDGLLLTGPPEALARAIAALGEETPGRLARDHADLDTARFTVSKAAVVGVPISALPRPEGGARIVAVQRGDRLLAVHGELTLEFGDRVTVLAPPAAMPAIRAALGDSVGGNAELSFVSIGLGLALGLALGLVPIPLGGGASFSLGVGGPLIVALGLGWLGRTGPIAWRMPAAASMLLRNLGLAVFLGAVAIGAGPAFVGALAASGPAILLAAVLVAALLAGAVLAAGHFVLRLRFDELLGIAAGATGNPAILAAAQRLVPTDRPALGYAMIFPSMTVAKILLAQLVLG